MQEKADLRTADVDDDLDRGEDRLWRGHARAVIATFCGGVVLLVLFVALLNPFGNLPTGLFGRHVVMDINQRFQYPALIREKNFDSFVLGTSTSRLLDPDQLAAKFGGRFINLAINSGRAWEQAELGKLAVRNVPHPRNVLIGLDYVWCAMDADVDRITERGFPEWMFDDDPYNDVPFMLNFRTVEIAARKLFYHLGFIGPRVPSNGYEVFVPPEADYDAKKAARKIWRGRRRNAKRAPYLANEAERKAWRFPALSWLDTFLGSLPPETNKMLMWMPVHIAGRPPVGTVQLAREEECKLRVAAMAARHKAHDVDFRITSAITKNDKNYWDRLHYRVPIATQIVDELAQAVKTGVDSPKKLWVYSAGPAAGKL